MKGGPVVTDELHQPVNHLQYDITIRDTLLRFFQVAYLTQNIKTTLTSTFLVSEI
jgi:hypothetical protein